MGDARAGSHERFRFVIKGGRDGRHRWYLYDAAGTLIRSHGTGFPSGLDAYHDVERLREELSRAPILGVTAAVTAGPRRSNRPSRRTASRDIG